jgi:tripartite-type tricarboxylate transporter receptor subunit TctC
MTMLSRRLLLAGGAAAALTASIRPARAQAFPAKPLHVVVPFTAGGGTDILARVVGQRLAEQLGQQIVVENKPGGNTLIATEYVAKAAPDGYTLLMQTNNFTVNASLYQKLSYDTVADFTPVSLVASNPHILVVTDSLPVKSLAEFIALAKQKPGEITFGTAGSGTVNHLSAELLKIMAGIDMTHVPYKGSGSLIPDLIGGQILAHFAALPVVIGHIRAGRLRPLALTTLHRHPSVPDVPTIDELGFKGYEFASWFGLIAPAKTPPEIVKRIADETATAVRHPDVLARLTEYEAHGSTSEEFAAFIRHDIDKARELIKVSGAQID